VPLSTFDAEPQWLSDATQYFAPLLPDDVTIELSTVDALARRHDGVRRHRPVGPLRRTEVRSRGGAKVASELRLLTELERQRQHQVGRILRFLSTTGYDIDLIHRD
jgi:hypothetical protein